MLQRLGSFSHRRALLLLLAAALASFLLPASSVEGRPNIRAAFFVVYPGAVGSRLDNLPSIQAHCGVCHYRFTGGGTRNPYGAGIEAVLPNYPNSDLGRQQAVASVQGADPDGDAYSSLVEITDLTTYWNTPTFPGLNPTNVSQVTNVNVNDILAYLVPEQGGDVIDPVVTVVSPNGGESWQAGAARTVSWTATDNVGVTAIDVFYRDAEAAPWAMIAREIANSGSFTWFVHNTPASTARVRVVARDAAGNDGADQSNSLFTITQAPGGIVPTTLRDFHQPGSQPFQAGFFQDRTACASCHGGYDPAVEPDRNFQGSMMAQAMRDPLFKAAVAIAEQDAPSSGDLCLRCHTPFGWLSGRSNPTDGSALVALDRDGVACDFCHRMTDPVYAPGQSPPEDQAIIDALNDGDEPFTYLNGQYVVDPLARRRGPFSDAAPPHAFLVSPVHTSSRFCGTCHDVSNPAIERIGGDDYAPGPLDEKADVIDAAVLMPVERTYSEWGASAYPAGVYQPEFAGNKPSGIVSTCQDCHMRDVSGKGCNDPGAPTRPDLPLHDMTGGNAWIPGIVAQLYPGEVDASALAAGAARAVSMLEKAALLDVVLVPEADSARAEVTITNQTGHKLPTGYPEGRRMWVNLVAYDAGGEPLFESGAYDSATGTLTHDEQLGLYEVELGLSPGLASAVGLASGPSLHFVLNDTIYRDTRIPPRGFTNAGFDVFGGRPVDADVPPPRYADGQYWDVATYRLPAGAQSAIVTLYYQTTSKEMIEFLRDENTTNTAGDDMHALWTGNGRAAPVAMIRDTAFVDVTTVAGSSARTPSIALSPNPFQNALAIRLDLPRPMDVAYEVFDVEGRRVATRDYGSLGGGATRLEWDGRNANGADVGSGVFWVRVRAGDASRSHRVVRLR
jgi:FlgD Ig-like domain/Bacterial Ig domain